MTEEEIEIEERGELGLRFLCSKCNRPVYYEGHDRGRCRVHGIVRPRDTHPGIVNSPPFFQHGGQGCFKCMRTWGYRTVMGADGLARTEEYGAPCDCE